jgi:hypothetical protein
MGKGKDGKTRFQKEVNRLYTIESKESAAEYVQFCLDKYDIATLTEFGVKIPGDDENQTKFAVSIWTPKYPGSLQHTTLNTDEFAERDDGSRGLKFGLCVVRNSLDQTFCRLTLYPKHTLQPVVVSLDGVRDETVLLESNIPIVKKLCFAQEWHRYFSVEKHPIDHACKVCGIILDNE